MHEIDQAVGKIAGEVRAEVSAAILLEAARNKYFGVAIAHGELDIGVGLVVTQQDVESRLSLLDEVIFERERLMFVGDSDVLDIDSLAHESAGLGIGLGSLQKIGANARSQIFRLTDVNNLAFSVFVEVTAGGGRKSSNFLVQIHGQGSGRIFSLNRHGRNMPAERLKHTC